jgi:NAD(P)-dependent dehydrogenase (short-subunit alcohol dehydrogenase family)
LKVRLYELKNQSILVTGASDGIGREIARYLMQNGARVAIHYNSNKKAAMDLLEEYGSDGSEVFQADLGDMGNCLHLWEKVLEVFGQLDSVVLNAGVYLEHATGEEDQKWLDTWRRTLAINLDSAGLLTKKAIAHFKDTGGGRLIYIASRAVFRGETEEYLGYAASKGGLVSLARSVARSFGKYNIKAFIIAPGFVRTAMANQFIETYGEQRICGELALSKLTEPKDISPLVALMCSGLMDHATGATVDINAGSHIR